MRVIVLGRFPPPFQGQSIATKVLADLLASTGLIVVEVGEEFRPRADTQVVRSGSLRDAVTFARRVVAQLIRLRGTVAAAAPDVVVYTGLSATVGGHVRNVLTLLVCVPRGVRVVAPLHNGDFDSLSRIWMLRPSVKWLISRVSTIVALSNSLRARLSPEVASRSEVIPNTLDREFDSMSPATGVRRNRVAFRLCFVGNLIEEKGYRRVVSAWESLYDAGLKVELIVIGAPASSADTTYIKDRLEARGSHGLSYRGAIVDRSELATELAEIDVVVLPTSYRHEAQPMVILEAMASGKPVIASRVGGIPELVEHEVTGFLLDDVESSSIANAVRRLMRDDVYASMSTQSRVRYNQEFARAVTARRWHELLQRSDAH